MHQSTDTNLSKDKHKSTVTEFELLCLAELSFYRDTPIFQNSVGRN